jgi:hypothetical protein
MVDAPEKTDFPVSGHPARCKSPAAEASLQETNSVEISSSQSSRS